MNVYIKAVKYPVDKPSGSHHGSAHCVLQQTLIEFYQKCTLDEKINFFQNWFELKNDKLTYNCLIDYVNVILWLSRNVCRITNKKVWVARKRLKLQLKWNEERFNTIYLWNAEQIMYFELTYILKRLFITKRKLILGDESPSKKIKSDLKRKSEQLLIEDFFSVVKKEKCHLTS